MNLTTLEIKRRRLLILSVVIAAVIVFGIVLFFAFGRLPQPLYHSTYFDSTTTVS